MRPHSSKVIAILLLCTLIPGCYLRSVPKEELRTKHNIMIVPFRAPPVAVIGHGTGAVLLGGVVGTAVMESTTKAKREQIADELNEIRGQWEANIVLAEECSDLIKKSTNLQVENIFIVESRAMPGFENEGAMGSKIFTAEPLVYGLGSPSMQLWMRSAAQMQRNSRSHIQYKQEYAQIGADWALEVFTSYIQILRMKTIKIQLYLKLVETSSGKRVAVYTAADKFPVFVGQDFLNFKLFEEEYRSAARQLCTRLLGKMGLISLH